ncbi:hypothetical protein ACIBH1_45655 [Nonomuraea sp. NPDC050663]|uniref:hypothetical protein n=1 Tax=Nonomuraea sp. NPDC050663 TaxID=3364370 RepID=UPI0037990E0C
MPQFTPNQAARSILRRLEEDGWTCTPPDAPHRSVWAVRLARETCWLGVLQVSAAKGRALRISLLWHPYAGSTRGLDERHAEGAHDIRALIGQTTRWGWQPAILTQPRKEAS